MNRSHAITAVQTGFPSPAQDYVELSLDFNNYCIEHPHASYILKVAGNPLIEAGIYTGDTLVVDRSLQAEHLDIVVAQVDDELVVRILQLRPFVCLLSGNPLYPPITFTEDASLEIFGVVTCVVRKLPRPFSKQPL